MRQTIREGNFTWVDIQNPSKEDMEYLKKNFHLNSFLLNQLELPAWRPKFELFAEHLLLILYYPFYSKEEKDTSARELDILVTNDTVITFHYTSILPLKSLFNSCSVYPEARKETMERGTGFLTYAILNAFWEHILTKLTRINKKIDLIERKIFQGEERAMVREISLAKADVLDFWRFVEPQGQLLSQLRSEGTAFLQDSELKQYFSHILDHYHQAVHDLETYRETLRSLEETNNSLLTTEVNETVKFLTVFSAIMLPLTFITQLFGMNTSLPFTDLSYDFQIISGIMVAILLGTIVVFKQKKWL
ncbi:MAG: magnesium transporter CorA family protein [bacterium]|nr:magnesium transporter CorA family protein [bacterium]